MLNVYLRKTFNRLLRGCSFLFLVVLSLVFSSCIRFTPVVSDSVTPAPSSEKTETNTSTRTTAGSLKGATFESGSQFTMNSYVTVVFTDKDGDQSGKANWVKVGDTVGNGYISTSTENLVDQKVLRINTGTPKDKLKIEYNNGGSVATIFANVVGGKATVDF